MKTCNKYILNKNVSPLRMRYKLMKLWISSLTKRVGVVGFNVIVDIRGMISKQRSLKKILAYPSILKRG